MTDVWVWVAAVVVKTLETEVDELRVTRAWLLSRWWEWEVFLLKPFLGFLFFC